MNILIELNHPAHYHLFRNFAYNMKKNGNRISFVVKQKDVLLELVENISSDFEIFVRSYSEKKGGFWHNLVWLIKSDIKTLFFALKFKPDILLGSGFSIAHVGKLLRKPSFLFAEDDVDIIPQLAKMAYPFVSQIISPLSCKNGKFENKSIKYSGYHELAFLHPKNFTPDFSKVANIYSSSEKNYLLRFSGLSAHHDKNISGLTTELAHTIINILSPYGNIFITSERTLESTLEQYRILINPKDIHHALYFADIYIGDSQSMAMESAVLGTPSIRFSDFSGEIGVLSELEDLGLTFSYKSNQAQEMLNQLKFLLDLSDLKEEWKKRHSIMLKDKIDVTAFMVWLIENYPHSVAKLQSYDSYRTHGLTPELASQLF